MTYTSAESVGNKWPDLQFRAVDKNVVIVTKACLQLEDGSMKERCGITHYSEWIEKMGK